MVLTRTSILALLRQFADWAIVQLGGHTSRYHEERLATERSACELAQATGSRYYQQYHEEVSRNIALKVQIAEGKPASAAPDAMDETFRFVRERTGLWSMLSSPFADTHTARQWTSMRSVREGILQSNIAHDGTDALPPVAYDRAERILGDLCAFAIGHLSAMRRQRAASHSLPIAFEWPPDEPGDTTPKPKRKRKAAKKRKAVPRTTTGRPRRR